MEVLAPAGDLSCLEAALEAGADAVYLGLGELNARRRARNFTPEEFARAVALAHAKGARVYLTLNIDLAERELGEAARVLALAQAAGADAVLVKDPALLLLRPATPKPQFHFSTQTGMTNRADVTAVGGLGAARAVLARELSLREIAAASRIFGVATEVFAQGALCFSMSGRCLMSSWVGGRSGNRGACTSPCRVPWSVEGEPGRTLFSMRDLGCVHRVAELRAAGVRALKIEGRLKTPVWVGKAVGLYRRALAGEDPATLLREAAELGKYTGRELCCGYLDEARDGLTGIAGREPGGGAGESPGAAAPAEAKDYDLSGRLEGGRLECLLAFRGREARWTVSLPPIRREHKAVPFGLLCEALEREPIQGCSRAGGSEVPDVLLPPRLVKSIRDRISVELRLGLKKTDGRIQAELAPLAEAVLVKSPPHESNRRSLGGEPDRARIEAGRLGAFLKKVRPGGVIVEGLTAGTLEAALRAAKGIPLVAALPSVFFDDDIPAVKELLQACQGAGVTVEVNSWGGWRLAREVGVKTESGLGLPVLNSLAAKWLAEAGLSCVALSVEADRIQLEDVSAHCPVAASLVVFGRPPLFTSRVDLSKEGLLGKIVEDRRGVRARCSMEDGLWMFRPVEPFDLRGLRNPKIRVRHLVADLVGSDDPVRDWLGNPGKPGSGRFLFNYDRKLA